MTDAEFLAIYPNATNDDIAKTMGVSTVTVKKRAHRLGVKKSPEHWKRMQAERMMGKERDENCRAKIRSKAIGRTVSPNTIEKALRTKAEHGSLLKGEKHPNWKGGRPWERFKAEEYKAWRTAVLERDGYVCQRCHRQCRKREKGLAAHHEKPYKDYPELRYQVSNGVTLCRACHMELHGKNYQMEVIPCACGCGTMIPSKDPYGRPRRFANFHFGRHRERNGEGKFT